ncbi:MAG: AsnC family transcriptional regulator, partial [Nocardioidaceae bacterium]
MTGSLSSRFVPGVSGSCQTKCRSTSDSVGRKHDCNEIPREPFDAPHRPCEHRRVTSRSAKNGSPGPRARVVLDDVSKSIIEELQQDGRRSYASIGKVVGLSEAAVR